MSESLKCFCDMYRDCKARPSRETIVGIDPQTRMPVHASGEEFVKKADEICPGTRVYLANAALNGDVVKLDDANDTVTLPRDAITLQCEFYRAILPK